MPKEKKKTQFGFERQSFLTKKNGQAIVKENKGLKESWKFSEGIVNFYGLTERRTLSGKRKFSTISLKFQ